MAREIWSTDFVTDSRTGTDGPLWWGESAQEGCQRTLSRTRGRERTVRCGGESPRRRAVNGPLRVTDSRTGTDVRFGRESPRGGRKFGKRIAILTAVSIVVSCPHGKG